MVTGLQAEEIAKAIVLINRTAAITGGNDARWIKNDFIDYLAEYRFETILGWLCSSPPLRWIWPTRLSWFIWWRTTNPKRLARKIRGCWLLSDEFAQATIDYLNDRRFADVGFPINNYDKIGRLFRAALYRVSFGCRWRNAREFQELFAHKEFVGVYRVYLKRAGLDNVECRLLVLAIEDNDFSVVATEISKAATARGEDIIRIRFGAVVPGFDTDTLVLSEISDPDSEKTMEKTIRYDDEVGDAKIDLTSRYRTAANLPIRQDRKSLAPSVVPRLQAQDLAFYAIRHSAESISGTFHWKDDVGRVEGQRMHRKEITCDDLKSITVPVPAKSIPNQTPLNMDLLERFNRRSFSSDPNELAIFEFRQMAYSSSQSADAGVGKTGH